MNWKKRYKETESDWVRREIGNFMSTEVCPACQGKRLCPEALSVTIENKNISDFTELTIDQAREFVKISTMIIIFLLKKKQSPSQLAKKLRRASASF